MTEIEEAAWHANEVGLTIQMLSKMNAELIAILKSVECGDLPDKIDSNSDIDINLFKELYDADLVDAIDSTSFDGPAYLNPKITFTGREYLKNQESGGVSKNDDLPEKITLAWLFHNVPYKFWFWLVGLIIASFLAGVQSTKLSVVKEAFNLAPLALEMKTDEKPASSISTFKVSLLVLEPGTNGSTFNPHYIESLQVSNNLNFIQVLQRISRIIKPIPESTFPYKIFNFSKHKWIDDLESPVPTILSSGDKIIFVSKKVIADYGSDIDLYRTAASLYFNG